ncbi:hypothetical protein [Caulobacter sp. RL271]|jgi:hypothetical protein|uniref:Secreted protein n=1 Tax=Caulobacter segnis TaxID=88688 RepID=A0ABY5A001_9CAUL|nr:hypothetical protein [Caulobacter segnis]USQ98126.1 hypothetical protein MZV50_11520 [Caulobacter segnis]
MRKLTVIALMGAALASAAAPAFAQSTRWTDAEYLKAGRCLGLAQSAQLGTVDASGLTARIKDQAKGREPYVLDRGENLRDEARRAGGTRNEAVKARLLAERDGSCKAFLGTSVAASGASS